MRSNWKDMEPVDDFVTQQTPGLKITQKVWGDMQCAYHSFAPGTDFTELLKPLPDGLCGVPHHAYVISGSMDVIYKDGSVETCKAGDVCYWPAPHNFISRGRRGDHTVQRFWCVGQASQGNRRLARENAGREGSVIGRWAPFHWVGRRATSVDSEVNNI